MYGGSIFWSLGWPLAGLGPCAGCHVGRGPEISSAWCCGRSGTPINNGHLYPFVRCTLWDYYVYIYMYIILYIYLSLPSISLLYSHDINNQLPATYSFGNHHVFCAKPQLHWQGPSIPWGVLEEKALAVAFGDHDALEPLVQLGPTCGGSLQRDLGRPCCSIGKRW